MAVEQGPAPGWQWEEKPAAPAEETRGPVERFAASLLPSTTLKDYWEGPAYVAQHPLDSMSLIADAIKKDPVGAVPIIGNLKRVVTKYESGDIAGAAGELVAAGLISRKVVPRALGAVEAATDTGAGGLVTKAGAVTRDVVVPAAKTIARNTVTPAATMLGLAKGGPAGALAGYEAGSRIQGLLTPKPTIAPPAVPMSVAEVAGQHPFAQGLPIDPADIADFRKLPPQQQVAVMRLRTQVLAAQKQAGTPPMAPPQPAPASAPSPAPTPAAPPVQPPSPPPAAAASPGVPMTVSPTGWYGRAQAAFAERGITPLPGETMAATELIKGRKGVKRLSPADAVAKVIAQRGPATATPAAAAETAAETPPQPAAPVKPPAAPKFADPDYGTSTARMRAELGYQARQLGMKGKTFLEEGELQTGLKQIKKGISPDVVARQIAEKRMQATATGPAPTSLSPEAQQIFDTLVKAGKSEAEAMRAVQASMALQERFGSGTLASIADTGIGSESLVDAASRLAATRR